MSLALHFPQCVTNVNSIQPQNSSVQDASQTTSLCLLTNNTVGINLLAVRFPSKIKLGTFSIQILPSEKEVKTEKNSTPVLSAYQAITGNQMETDKENALDAAFT